MYSSSPLSLSESHHFYWYYSIGALSITFVNEVFHSCQQILDKGELQISDKERQNQMESSFKEIATIIADKCVNPDTKRPYPVTMIEKSMKQIHFSVKPNKNNKQQALVAMKELKEKNVLPIERAQMKIRVMCNKKHRQSLRQMAKEVEEDAVHEDGQLEMVSFWWLYRLHNWGMHYPPIDTFKMPRNF